MRILIGPAYCTQHDVISLNIMTPVLIHVISSSLRFNTTPHSLAMNTPQFIIHFTAEGHLGYFQCWTIKNEAAIKIPAYAFAL